MVSGGEDIVKVTNYVYSTFSTSTMVSGACSIWTGEEIVKVT